MKKHILALALVLSLLAAPAAAAEPAAPAETPAPAETEAALPAAAVGVTVNGEPVQWTDAAPFIDENDRTLVPLRAVAEALGLNVEWDDVRREAVFYGHNLDDLAFPIGGSYAYSHKGIAVPMDTAAVIVNDRTFAPVRYLAEYFGFTVDWDGETRTVCITGEETPATKEGIRLETDSAHYEQGQTIGVSYAGVPRTFLDEGAVIGLMGAWTDSGRTVLAVQPVTAEEGTVYFTAPAADGFFALQFFRTGTADELHRLDNVSVTAAVGFVPGGQG